MKSGRRIISEARSTPPRRLRLLVSHSTAYHYPMGASRLQLVLRLWPEPHAGQVVRKWQVTVNDEVVQPGARTGHGDRCALWSAAAAPGDVVIAASGIIETEDRSGLVTGLTVRPNPAIFLRETDQTRADKAIRDLAPPPGQDRIPWLHSLMATIKDRLPYVSGATTVETTAMEALKAGAGVCQDHAHLFIAAARAHGVPARYVCGYMLAGEGEQDLHETHAWAEAWVDGLGWTAFDPSTGLCPTERYIRMSTGLDAFDASPIRGHATGGGSVGVHADVRIAPSAGHGTGEGEMEARLRAQQQQSQQQ